MMVHLLLTVSEKNLGMEKKNLHNNLHMKNGLGNFLSIDFLLRLFHSLFDIPLKRDEYAVKIKLDNYQKFLVWIKLASHFSH